MDTLLTMITVAGSIAAIIGLFFTYDSFRFSKRNILKRIEKKANQIRQIDKEIVNRYGLDKLYSHGGYITPLEAKKNKLQKEIEELRRLL